MTIIILAIIIVLIVSIIWIWHCLGDIDKKQKILFIIVGLIIVFIATFIIFQIAKTGIIYEKQETRRDIQNILVTIFTVTNSLILLPYIARQLNKVKNKQLKKEKLNANISFIIIIFVICLILECGYMRDVQQGILKIYQQYCDVM